MVNARKRTAIVGTAGVPAAYGGFETLAENLVRFNDSTGNRHKLTVYCTGVGRDDPPEQFGGAELIYINLDANGIQSIAYDAFSLLHAVRTGHQTILLLGVSGALFLPFVRTFSGARVLTNVDGIEWKRAKWGAIARFVLRLAEWAAVRFSHVVIADNTAIAEHLMSAYGAPCQVIAYGGDHALEPRILPKNLNPYGKNYALALCRIEPENNVKMILEAWEEMPGQLVFVGNWSKSQYGRELAERYNNLPNIAIVDPIYEPAALKQIREDAGLYLHGHSAGGTNPSLVEMMHFKIPIFAYDCVFNRFTTNDDALYFGSVEELRSLITALTPSIADKVGRDMAQTAQRCYTWDQIGASYLELLET